MFDRSEYGLERGARVLLDSSPLMYLIEGKDAERVRVVRSCLEAARSGEISLIASIAAWTECLVGPLARKDPEKATEFRRTLSDSNLLVLEPVDVRIAERAAELLARFPALQSMDALHLATAAETGAAAVLTNDGAWRGIAEKAMPRGPKILLVDELAFGLR